MVVRKEGWKYVQWLISSLQAERYILDPLTAPEPSQECGPGSSFIGPAIPRPEQPESEYSPESRCTGHRRCSSRSRKKRPSYSSNCSVSSSPSAFPTHLSFDDVTPCLDSCCPKEPVKKWSRSHRATSSLSYSVNEGKDQGNHHPERRQNLRHSSSCNKCPPVTPNIRAHSTIQTPSTGSVVLPKNQSLPTTPMATSQSSRSRSNSERHLPSLPGGHRRCSSLPRQYPGDMSHRPLEILRREARTADRVPHLWAMIASNKHQESESSNPFVDKHKKARGMPFTDTIDRLDHSAPGGTYHHGGPFDAALAARNVDPMYAPMEAVRESNMEALKATPRDCVIDSVTRHVPLQGTASLPPGVPHPRTGEILQYKEGADLMRESDAGGGPYSRWEGIVSFDKPRVSDRMLCCAS